MPRLDVSEIRKEQIIDAARTLFGDRGIATVRLDEVAARVDLSKAALYLYYPGKEAIVAAVLDRHTARARKLFDAAARSRGGAFRQLLAFVAVVQSPELPVRLRCEMVGLAISSPTVQSALTAYQDMVVRALTRFFEDLARRGEFVDLAPDVAARRVLYLCEGILIVRASILSAETLAAETEAILRSFATPHFVHPLP